ncbi:hypothetical protein Glove_15g23 [Diversispora epigaea]|uniref:Protein kinase domain-containing protein n=1 Tax=Diversispora epigaea TaxID=1348612 RepID=A0A397JTI4_9GLOM|nr:hypothetical protein Glove_15g23 [Diversispora epigaea]
MPYIAPEVLSGDEEYTKAADVYSYGIIACEMITGYIPIYHMIKIYDYLREGKTEEFSENQESTNTAITTPLNYQTHPQAIYTSRFNFSNLTKPKNEENFERELEKLTKSMSNLCPNTSCESDSFISSADSNDK